MSIRASQVMSSVPTSCIQVESTVLPVSIDKIWPKFRALQLDSLAPSYVVSTETTGEGVGSIVSVTYKDGTVWELRVTEISVSQTQVYKYAQSKLCMGMSMNRTIIVPNDSILPFCCVRFC